MAVSSSMLPLGSKASDFQLQDVTKGEIVRLESFAGKKALLVMFICRHCPYVKHVEREISNIGQDFQNSDLAIVAISSNDPQAYPEDSPDSLKEQAKNLKFNFPYCFDQTQQVARNYTAVCTPDFFLFDKERELVYRGQLDGSRPGNDVLVTGKDLRDAIRAVLEDRPLNKDQKPSTGCSIKWKVGFEQL